MYSLIIKMNLKKKIKNSVYRDFIRKWDITTLNCLIIQRYKRQWRRLLNYFKLYQKYLNVLF